MSKREFVMSPGQAHELDDAFVDNGWTRGDVKCLSTGDMLSLVKMFMNGKFGFKHPLFLPDPGSPGNPHMRMFKYQEIPRGFEFDPERLHLYQLSDQKTGGVKISDVIEVVYADQTVMPLNVEMRTYLRDNKCFIPRTWKQGQNIFFLGTVTEMAGDLCSYTLQYCRGPKDWKFDVVYSDKDNELTLGPDDFVACLKL